MNLGYRFGVRFLVIMFIGRHVDSGGKREVEGVYVYRLRKEYVYS